MGHFEACKLRSLIFDIMSCLEGISATENPSNSLQDTRAHMLRLGFGTFNFFIPSLPARIPYVSRSLNEIRNELITIVLT